MKFFTGVLLIITLHFGHAQIYNDITQPKLSRNSLSEKVYLQLDNVLYHTGQTIWYKAIVTKSYDNSLSDISEILHVELIDVNETIVDKKLLKLKNGIANGSFILEDSYKAGKYSVRAYTTWNRNFQEDYIYSQSIDVINVNDDEVSRNPIMNVVIDTTEFKTIKADINPRIVDPKFKNKLWLYVDTGAKLDSVEINREKNDIYKLDYKLPENCSQANLKFKYKTYDSQFEREEESVFSETVVINKDFLDVQFFPEGGKLVNGLLSTVAFKAIDYKGLGYEISGTIKDNNDNLITSFNGNKLGMGTFKLIPKKGNSYYAEIFINNRAYRYNLPVAKLHGSVISLVNLKDDLKFLVASNSKTTENFVVETQARGVKYHSLAFRHKDSVKASIPKSSLPDGIIKVSLLNDKKQIICERLIFNNKFDNRLDIEVELDKSSYLQRDKVGLTLRLDSIHSIDDVNSSVLVIDKGRVNSSRDFKAHILSYLLVSSELKGFIENPSYYFNETNKERLMDLDALLLTQGWRDYKYDQLLTRTNYSFGPEKNLIVSGTIGQYFNPLKKPKEPLDINMIVYDEPADIYNQEIDSTGKYRFEIDDFYKAKTNLFMQVVDKKGKPIDFDINVDKVWTPEIKSQIDQNITLPDQIISRFEEKTKINNKREHDYQVLYNTIKLDEIKLSKYKLTPQREESIELHGEPYKVIEGKELKENAPEWNFGIYSVLQSKYPDIVRVKWTSTNPAFLYAKVIKSDLTLVLVDNIPVNREDYRYIQSIPVEEVESIDFILDVKDIYRYAFEIFGTGNINFGTAKVSYINIYTTSRKGLHGITKTVGVNIREIKGFEPSVEFYSPNYENLSNQDWVIPDNRSVIYWEPNITLNSNGEYTLKFYNDDHIGEVSIIVETITKDGKIGYLEKTYTIKEAER